MTTARTIIKRAMQKAGILTKNEVPSSDEASDALDTLNDLFASVANETSMTSVRTVEQFQLNANQGSYTLGAGGDFNTSRPTFIASGYIRSGTVDYPLAILADTTYDRNTSTKNTASIPEFFVADNGFPLINITLYPVPVNAYQIFLRLEKPLAALTLDSEIELPPGWSHYLVHELATLLQPEYGQPVDQGLKEIANQAKDNIMLTVMKNRTMDAVPVNDITGFDIYSSRYR